MFILNKSITTPLMNANFPNRHTKIPFFLFQPNPIPSETKTHSNIFRRNPFRIYFDSLSICARHTKIQKKKR